MAAIGLPPFGEFELLPRETAAIRFDKYIRRLSNMFKAMDITDPERQKAMLLHYMGEQATDIFDTLTMPAVNPDDQTLNDVYKCATRAIKEHFEPHKSVDHLVYSFRKEVQSTCETVSEFYTRLVILAKRCDFQNSDLEIKRQIIQGTTSHRLRRKAIESSLSLADLLKHARAMEMANEQTSVIEKTHVNYVAQSNKKHFKPTQYTVRPNQTCGLCGGPYPHKGECRAKGKECRLCGRMNHFAKVCRSKIKVHDQNSNKNRPKPKHHASNSRHNARVVETDRESCNSNVSYITKCDSDDEYTFHLGSPVNSVEEKPFFDITILGTKVRAMADSGATVNILNYQDYQKLDPKPQLQKSKTKIYPYMSNESLPVRGKFETTLENDQFKCHETIYVVEGPSSSLISWKTSQLLNLIRVANNINSNHGNTVPEFLSKFPNVTNGMGACKCDPVKVHVNPGIAPVAQPHRRIPFHVRKKVEEKIKELEEADIIERVDGPTPWISPIVVVPKPKKPDEIRICVDMRSVNRAIIRERHIIPTIEDISADLNGCTVFSKLDLAQGYHQVVLHPESRNLSTFSTHIGLFRYKRLNFGMSCSAEIFQKIISDVIQGIPRVKNISDDIYIGGFDNDDHDKNLVEVFRRLSENNLTINPQKCEFKVPKMIFFGHQFSAQGISPDPKKVADLKSTQPPTDVTGVRSLLSSAAFCSKFIKNFSLITKPLRRLTCKEVQWQWGVDEQRAMENLQSALSEQSTLSYFDPEKETILFVDGSPIGLGAVLAQKDRKTGAVNPLHFASHPLTETESRYPQIDREALAIYWSIKRFHLYLYGSDFKVVTDHQPLVTLFNNAMSKPSARIERWLLDLQHYRFTVEYQPGPNNPADFGSRHPTSVPSNMDTDADHHIAYILQNAVPKAMTLEEIEEATVQDELIQATMLALKTGKWHNPPTGVSLAEMRRMEIIKDELTCTDMVLLKSNRIVVPTKLQGETVDIAHSGHLGIAKTKALLREKVWFPMMDKMVEQKVKSCLPCQIATPMTAREPLQMSPLPNEPFEKISIDFAHVDNETVLLVIDDYSRFPFIEPVRSTAAQCVIPKLDQIFAIMGTPEVVRSDNGPPFCGEEFKKFSEKLGFKHRKVTPLWPRANGQVENFVSSFKKHVRVAKATGANWRKELQSFLRDYRTSPHETTGIAPATLLLKRAVRNKLPQIANIDPIAEIVRVRDTKRKEKMKNHADNKSYVKPNNFDIGDHVLVKRPFNMAKGNTPFECTPLIVTDKKGTMITACNNEKTVTRNSSFFKKLHLSDLPSDSSDRENNISDNDVIETGANDNNSNVHVSVDPEHVEQPVEPLVVPELSGDKLNVTTPNSPPLRRSNRVRKPRNILDL